jgi:hypothetical protein
MKKQIFSMKGFAAAALLAFTFTSCGDDKKTDNGIPPIGGYNTSDEVAASNLVAKFSFENDVTDAKGNITGGAASGTGGIGGPILLLGGSGVLQGGGAALSGGPAVGVGAKSGAVSLLTDFGPSSGNILLRTGSSAAGATGSVLLQTGLQACCVRVVLHVFRPA